MLSGRPAPACAHGDAHELIGSVSRLIAESPANAGLYQRRAELNLNHGDLKSAEADYQQARRLQPERVVVSLGLARIRTAQGRSKEAILLLDEFLLQVPGHAGGRVLRAGLLEAKGDWKKAEVDLRAAATTSPEPHHATLHAQLLERHGMAAEAVRCLDAASQRQGRVPVLEQLALETEERAGHTEASLLRLNEFITLEPRPDIWLVRKARLLEKNGRWEEAKTAWDLAASALERIPAHKRGTKANQSLAEKIQAARRITYPKPK